MYKFMEVVSERSNYRTLYRFITTTDDDGNTVLLTADTDEELATTVEYLLTQYAKSKLFVVQEIDYTIYTIDYDNDSCCNCESATDSEVQDVVDEVLGNESSNDTDTDADGCNCETATDEEVQEVIDSVLNKG